MTEKLLAEKWRTPDSQDVMPPIFLPGMFLSSLVAWLAQLSATPPALETMSP